jgi:hypothetical protein
MNAAVAVAIIAGGVVVSSVLFWNFAPRRLRSNRLAGRSDLSLDRLHKEFFEQQNLPKELVFELLKEIADSLRLPPGKLRSTDRFDQELSPPKGWEYDDETLDIQWAAERRLKQSGRQIDLSQIKTVGDYVEFFCSLAMQKQIDGKPKAG